MPYEVRIDNYHGGVHVHPPRGWGPPVPTRELSKDEAHAILRRHLWRYRALAFDELLEELK